MQLIVHRVNTIAKLKNIPKKYGVEIDIRAWGSDLILNHDPFQKGEKLDNYLDEYKHGTLVLNIKEVGIEDKVLRFVRDRPQINSYFLLDVEFPYLYRASRLGEKNIAIRFSEDESIETVKKYVDWVDWVWIDTNTIFPITNENKNILNKFKKILVCPALWDRPNDIKIYKQKMDSISFEIDAVVTSKYLTTTWLN